MNKNKNTIDKKLLEIIVCPITKEKLEYDQSKSELISKKAKLAFPVQNGIPIMLIDKARKIKD